MVTTLWVCCKTLVETGKGMVWEIQGVFDTEKKAKKACINSNYGIGPVILNQALPDKTVEWIGFYYPVA